MYIYCESIFDWKRAIKMQKIRDLWFIETLIQLKAGQIKIEYKFKANDKVWFYKKKNVTGSYFTHYNNYIEIKD